MKNKQTENIDLENVLFHFSDGDIKSIEEKGLEARIGHNSGGVETHKKVFFSTSPKFLPTFNNTS